MKTVVLVEPDKLLYLGHILIRELPRDITKKDFLAWWPHLNEHDRDRYTVDDAHNLITSAGRSQILNYIGNPLGNTQPFAQFFAVGTFPITRVSPGDTAVNGETLRLAPASATVTGNAVDISTFFNGSQGNATLTNCGIFGIAATSTPASGTLLTHALLNNYVKSLGQVVTFDYIISLQ